MTDATLASVDIAEARVREGARAKYRRDIDGLRAIAVAAVVLHHAFPDFIPGGFIGVDIFFVISGYLITGIIQSRIEGGNFTFADFYARRIRRIFPALAVVCLACMMMAWPLLISEEYEQLGKHVAAGAAFVSNFAFWSEAGYFDNSSITKPLLHLWSLGVEEQFYIVWPVVMLIAWKFGWGLLKVALAISAMSFLYATANLWSDPTGAFYSPLSRAWELLAGAGLAMAAHTADGRAWLAKIHQDKLIRAWLSVGGMALIVIGLVAISERTPFPGPLAILPVLGAVALIAAGGQTWLGQRVLGSRALVWLGLISYPLYLWHWPLLSFATISAGGPLDLGTTSALVALSVVLAAFTYLLVERPLRFGSHLRAKALGLCVVMAAIGATGATIFVRDGVVPGSFAERYAFFAHYDYFKDATPEELFKDTNCFMGIAGERDDAYDARCIERYPGRPTVMLLGDSFAYHLQSSLKPALDTLQMNLAAFSTGVCFPLSEVDYGDPDRNQSCRETNDRIRGLVASVRPDHLILFVNYQARLPKSAMSAIGASSFVEVATNVGSAKITVLGMSPLWSNGLPRALADHLTHARRFEIPSRMESGLDVGSLSYDAALRDMLAGMPGLEYLSTKDLLCNDEGCLTFVGPNLDEDMVYFDYGHFTKSGGDYVIQHLLFPGLFDHRNAAATYAGRPR